MGIINNLRKKSVEYKRKEMERRARKAFQVTELDGQLWLTHGGCYVCPCAMFKGEPVDTLKNIRACYVETIMKKYLENCK